MRYCAKCQQPIKAGLSGCTQHPEAGLAPASTPKPKPAPAPAPKKTAKKK